MSITTTESTYWEQYSLLPYNPNALYQKGGYELLEQIGKDDQVSSVMQFRRTLISGRGYRIHCDNPDIVEFVEWALDQVDIKQKINMMLSGDEFGFSLAEKVLQHRDNEGRSGIVIFPRYRPPGVFRLEQNRKGDVDRVIFLGQNEISIKPDKFLYYVNNQEFDNPYGRPDYTEGLYEAWWMKRAIMKFWGIYLERFATGKPIIETPDTANKPQTDQVDKILKNLSITTGIRLPKGFVAKILEGKSDGKAYREAIDKLDSKISRTLGFPDLTGMGGSETSGGSFALGKTQWEILIQFLENKQEEVERVINFQMLPDLVAANFPNPEPCKLRLLPISQSQLETQAELYVSGLKSKAFIPNRNDENWFRVAIGLQEVTKEEYEEREEEIIEPTEENPEQGEPPHEEKPDGTEEGDLTEEKNEEPQGKKVRNATPSEMVNYAAVETELNTGEKNLRAAVLPALNAAILGSFKQILEINPTDPDALTRVQQIRVSGNVIALAANAALTKSFEQGVRDARDELKARGIDPPGEGAFAKIRNIFVKNAAGLPEGFDFESYIEALSIEIGQDISDDIAKIIRIQLTEGIKNGLGTDDIIKEILRVSEEGYGSTAPTAKLSSIVRTSISNVYNEGRAQYYESVSEIITAYQFSAILDGRQTQRCNDLHGKVFKKGQHRLFMPPLHYRCRSILVAFTIYDDTPEFSDLSQPGFDGEPLTKTPKGFFR